MSGEIELGPFEEKYAIVGAGVFPIVVLLGATCIVGSLHVPHNMLVIPRRIMYRGARQG